MTTIAPRTPERTTPSGIIIPGSPPPASPGPVLIPSGLIVPGRGGLVTPGGDGDYTRTASGLLVPAKQGVKLLGSNPLVVVDAKNAGDMSTSRMYRELQTGYGAIAVKNGDAAAHIMTDAQRKVLDAVARQERHDRAVQAFLQGRREYQDPTKRA